MNCVSYLRASPLDENQDYQLWANGLTITDKSGNSYNGGRRKKISSFSTVYNNAGANPPNNIMNLMAVTGTALKEVKLQWVIPSDLTPNDLDDTQNIKFEIYRSKKEIQGENDLATATKVATVGIFRTICWRCETIFR